LLVDESRRGLDVKEESIVEELHLASIAPPYKQVVLFNALLRLMWVEELRQLS
jgi:hypothetical protein